MPTAPERSEILKGAAGHLAEEIPPSVFDACAEVSEGLSGSDLNSLMQAAVRRRLTSDSPLAKCLIGQLQLRWNEDLATKLLGKLIRTLHDSTETHTVRDLAALFERSPSTIQHHLKKGANA
jgi:hypothetical protein